MSLSKKEQIIEKAFEVFYANGFHSSGMDLLLSGTGISKRTLYNYFETKEDLIVETIRHYQSWLLGSLAERRAAAGNDPTKRILSSFDFLIGLNERGPFFGCYAINAKLEYANKHSKIESACGIFFDELESRFLAECKTLGCKNSKTLAQQITLLYRGSLVTLQHAKNPTPVQAAKAAVKTLLNESLP